MKQEKLWVLVADGSRARIVRDLAQQGRRFIARTDTENCGEDLIFEAEHKPLREIMSDRPGRSFASEGTRRSAMAYHSDPVREQEREFAVVLVDTLAKKRGDFDRLLIVAEPRMLGAIRQQLPDELRATVTGEVAKDYTKLGTKELRKAITEIEPAGLVRPAS